MAQKAINIAANWDSEQELQFSSKKTEIVLFTRKRNPDLGYLSRNGSKLEVSKEARLLGVTLDCKLTWKPHITRITRKATTALLQCRQIVGKTWGIKPCTVFTRFVARALIFFNLTRCRAPIQTGVYLSTGACYFQSKITTKIIVEDKYFTTFNLSPYIFHSIF